MGEINLSPFPKFIADTGIYRVSWKDEGLGIRFRWGFPRSSIGDVSGALVPAIEKGYPEFLVDKMPKIKKKIFLSGLSD